MRSNLLALPAEKLLTDHEATQLLDLAPGTLAVWRSTGRHGIPFVKIGRNVRYRKDDLEQWIESHTQSHGATA